MKYKESYVDLCHGTDEESADKIEETGFEIKGGRDSWCGKGVYFYDVKKKAWWAAHRKCREIRKETGRIVNPTVLFVDITDIEDDNIFDMRVYKDLCDFEKETAQLFGEHIFEIKGVEDRTERIVQLRSLMISFYSDRKDKQLVIGNFKQRPREDYNHVIEFANGLDMVFGIETIYCAKDKNIIGNIRRRCKK